MYVHVHKQTHTPVPTPAPPLRTRKKVIAKKKMTCFESGRISRNYVQAEVTARCWKGNQYAHMVSWYWVILESYVIFIL